MKTRILTGLCALMFAISAQASLTPFQTFTGTYGLSTDGFGSTTDAGTLTANAAAGSTVVAAYLYSSTFFTAATPSVTLNGNAVAFGPRVANGTDCCQLASFRADVTSIVAGVIDGGAGGAYNFNVVETGLGGNTDGEALVVVYSNGALATSTVGILDGFAAVGGDTATISYANPLDPTAAGFFAEMRLGIGFSCCDQKSNVRVNGTLITQNAGNNDDSADAILNNGNLITMGGDNDAFSPLLSGYADDHERYNLVPQISLGDTSITIRTDNPSNDDNIFLAVFHTSGEGIITTETPEPASLALLGLSLVGMGIARRRRTRS